MRVAVLGLGRMGWPIAGHLANADHDHDVRVFDINSDATQSWAAEQRGQAASSVAEAVEQAEIIVSSLPADAHVQTVVDEAFDHIAAGAIWLDHSTISAEGRRNFAERLATRARTFSMRRCRAESMVPATAR